MYSVITNNKTDSIKWSKNKVNEKINKMVTKTFM